MNNRPRRTSRSKTRKPRAPAKRATAPRVTTVRPDKSLGTIGPLLDGFRKSTTDLTQLGRELQQVTQQATQALQQAVDALADEVRRSEQARSTIELLQRQIQQLTADPGYSITRASRAGSQR